MNRRTFASSVIGSIAAVSSGFADPRKLQGVYSKYTSKIACIGDSHVNVNASYDRLPSSMFPSLLAQGLTSQVGRSFAAANWGFSGDTTRASTYSGASYPGILDRISCITGKQYIPSLVVVYGTTNNWTCINNSGTFTAGPSTTTANVDSDVTLVDLKSIIDSLVGFGVQRIVIGGYHLLNWSTGGDVTAGVINAEPSMTGSNPGTFGAGARWAQYQAAQYGIATYPGKVAFCDLYANFKTRLETSFPAQIGVDTFLCVANQNTHLNATGNQWVADAVVATIQSQPGWVTALENA